MNKEDIQVIKLSPMKMISFYSYGPHPETQCWNKLMSWVKEKKFKVDVKNNRIFGFNNPCPSVGSSNYGYEFWISVNEDIQPKDDMRLIDFSGGLYATVSFNIEIPDEELPEYWKGLNIWCEESNYGFANHQWLEEHSLDGKPIAMFMPISE